MAEHWYKEAVLYSLEVQSFQDSDDDGVGDFRGLIRRLDYLARLGVTCLWLNPIHPSPGRDDGYDVTDYYGVHPELGSLGDFAELVHQAANRGIKIIIDLVVNHTSDQHPWFVSARSSPDSPHRDWYVWSETEPPDRHQGMVFPGEQYETWTYDRTAKAWYYHRFYDFEPDLNTANPAVWQEVKKIVGFWTQLGVAGFRMDAAPFIIEHTVPGQSAGEKDFEMLTDLRGHLSWRRGDAIILAEANVEPSMLVEYFGDSGGSANRLHMLFDFALNGRLMLALAREDAEPVGEALRDTPPLPEPAQWATFLRNHDENDLSRLTADQRADVLAEFGPEPKMQLYGRGVRRRMAPMLGNDRRRIELRRRLRLPAGERDGAAPRPWLAAGLVRADDPHPAGVPGGRHRRLHAARRDAAAARAGAPGRCDRRRDAVLAQPARRGRGGGHRQAARVGWRPGRGLRRPAVRPARRRPVRARPGRSRLPVDPAAQQRRPLRRWR